MRLRDHGAGELLPGVVVVAVGAGEIQLADALAVKRLATLAEGREPGIVRRSDRHAARLLADIGGQREQFPAFPRKRRCLLLGFATGVDPALQVERTLMLGAKGWIARRDALHAGRRILMTVGAGLVGTAGLRAPERFAIEHRQHAGIGGVVLLHRLRLAAHEVEAGAAAVGILRDGGAGGRQQEHDRGQNADLHSTTSFADSICASPRSSIHENTSNPPSRATVVKAMKGLAAIAG